jgi:cytochrome c
MKLVSVLCLALFAPLAQADINLARSKNCMGCHAEKSKIVGPAFKEVAARYAKDKKAVETLAAKIIKGGKLLENGNPVWGAGPGMPPQNLTPDEAKKLATWVMSVK